MKNKPKKVALETLIEHVVEAIQEDMPSPIDNWCLNNILTEEYSDSEAYDNELDCEIYTFHELPTMPSNLAEVIKASPSFQKFMDGCAEEFASYLNDSIESELDFRTEQEEIRKDAEERKKEEEEENRKYEAEEKKRLAQENKLNAKKNKAKTTLAKSLNDKQKQALNELGITL